MVELTCLWLRLSNKLIGLSQTSNSMRDGMARPKADSWFNAQKQYVLDCSSEVLTKKPHLETRIESHQDSRKSSAHASEISTDSRKKGSHGGQHS